MEEFADDDFSDLYADVEEQASSAISAMHGCTEMPLGDNGILENAIGGEKEEGGGLSFTEIAAGNGGTYEKANVRRHGGGQETEEDEKKLGEIDGNEKSLNGGDYGSQLKNLRDDSLNYKKKRAVCQVHKQSQNGDADVDDDRDICFSNEGGKIVSERGSRHTPACDPVSLDLDKYGSVQISDSVEDNHHELSDCDSDGMDEAMETSDDTNSRNASSTSNKVPSVVEPESSESGRSLHGPGSSSSPIPRTALRYNDIEKSHKPSNKTSSSLVRESREAVTCDYHPSEDSRSHGVKPSTRDVRYSGRQRDPIRKKLKQHKRSNHMPDLKTHLKDEDAADDVKGLYEMHQSSIRHRKQRAMLNFDSSKNDMPYCNRSESFFTCFGGIFPDYHLGSAYLKNQYWNAHPSFGYEAGWCDGRMNEKQNFLEKKSRKMDYEALEDVRYHNQRRHVVQDDFKESRKQLPKYSSFTVNKTSSQSSKKGDGVQLRRIKKGGYLSPLRDYNSEFMEGKYRRFIPSSDGDRGHLDHRYDRNIHHDRSEMESSGRGKRRHDSPLNSSHNFWHMETEDNDRRYIKHQPLPFHSYEKYSAGNYNNGFIEGKYRRFMPSSEGDRCDLDCRFDRDIPRDRREMESSVRGKRRRDSPLNSSHDLWHMESEDNDRRYIKHRPLPFDSYKKHSVPCRERFQGAAGPKSGVPERNLRCSWKEIHIESGRYGSDIDTFDTNEGLRYHHTADHLVRKRHYQQSANTSVAKGSIMNHYDGGHFVRRILDQEPEVLHSNEDVYKSRQQDDTIFHREGPSYHFERISRNKRPDDRPAFDRAAELIDEREVDRGGFKMMREEDRSNQFEGSLKFIQPDSGVQMHPRYRDSADTHLGVVDKKCTLQSSRRTSEAGDNVYNGRYDLMEWNDHQEPNEGKVDTSLVDKNWHDKLSSDQHNEFLDIEEGQIITEEINEKHVKCVIASEDLTPINDMEYPETASNGNGAVEGLDDQKIREIMAKMERRRERFKDPITSSRDSEKTPKHLPDLDAETSKAKLERPARKRTWFGS